MKIAAGVVVCVLMLAGCSTGAASNGPSSAMVVSSSASMPAEDTFTLNGQVVLSGRFTSDSTEQHAPCHGTSTNSDLDVGTQVVVSAKGNTVALGSITETLTDFVTKPGLYAMHIVVDDVPGGLGFYSVKIGSHDAPELSEADARETVKLTLG